MDFWKTFRVTTLGRRASQRRAAQAPDHRPANLRSVARPRSLPLNLNIILYLGHSLDLTRECLSMSSLLGRLYDTAEVHDASLRDDIDA